MHVIDKRDNINLMKVMPLVFSWILNFFHVQFTPTTVLRVLTQKLRGFPLFHVSPSLKKKLYYRQMFHCGNFSV